ncbi:MAG: winged helix DNA-binding protein [Novosphingobium sp.]|nr:winged helix DNA-binding protein [Novosphingobium sp.]
MQANIVYAPARGADYFALAGDAPVAPVVSIFADRAHLRADLRSDVEAAGMRVSACDSVAALVSDHPLALGDVVFLDCPQLDAAAMAALTRLDVRATKTDAQLVVSTSLDVLDEVFSCLSGASVQLLVEPSRADRVIALGRALAAIPNLRVRELSEEDRLALLRLTEQVSQVASRLDRLTTGGEQAAGSAFRFESPGSDFKGEKGDGSSDRLVRATRPGLPDPRLVRRIIRQRQLRARFFDGELFADPAWDMLLDLTAARAEHERVSVTSLCIASGVPPTTALRWIGQLTEAGLVERIEDEADRRRAFIALTDKAADGMARYFAELGRDAGRLV